MVIHNSDDEFICSHLVAETKEKAVINTDHKRDKSVKINELIKQTAAVFDDGFLATEYFELLRKDKGRYIRDHIQALSQEISSKDKNQVSQVLKNAWRKNTSALQPLKSFAGKIRRRTKKRTLHG